MCSTAQLVSITLNSAANEPRFTILNERVNVLGMGPLLALASAGLLSHTASLYGPHSYSHQQQSIPRISACWLQSRPLTRSMRRTDQHCRGILLFFVSIVLGCSPTLSGRVALFFKRKTLQSAMARRSRVLICVHN